MLSATPVEGLGEITAGFDLAAATADRLGELTLAPGDVLVIAHKAVSKAEGRLRVLAEVTPSARAQELATALEKDPRVVQVVLDESRAVIRADHGVLITETHHGFVCANSGVDASNVAGAEDRADAAAPPRRVRAGDP